MNSLCAEAHHDLASATRELGMAQDAIPHYRRALELLPDDVDSLIGIGAAQCDGGQVDEGIATLHRATEQHPDNGNAFANLGVALEGVGRDEEAASAYAKAVAGFDAALLEADDDDDAAEAALRLRWGRIQHAQLLERLERWPQAVVEFRHLYEEERALAEAEAEAKAEAKADEDPEGHEREPADESSPPRREVLDDGAEVDGESSGNVLEGAEPDDDEEEEDEEEPDELDLAGDAGRLGLERLFARLVQLGRIGLAYVVLDDLGGELSDDRTRAIYAIYDPGDGLPQIMVEHWDGGEREKLDPAVDRRCPAPGGEIPLDKAVIRPIPVGVFRF